GRRRRQRSERRQRWGEDSDRGEDVGQQSRKFRRRTAVSHGHAFRSLTQAFGSCSLFSSFGTVRFTAMLTVKTVAVRRNHWSACMHGSSWSYLSACCQVVSRGLS